MAVVEALELDLVEPEALLAVEEVGQALTEHRDLAGDRAIARETLELDWLHDVNGTARDPPPATERWYRYPPAVPP